MKALIFFFVVILLAPFAAPVMAEKANMSPALLRQTATHVVVGTVVRVYSRSQTVKGYDTTEYVAELRIKEVEKGEGLKEGDLLYARYGTQRWVGPGPPTPGTSGHRGLPREGDTLRVYLARNAYDGFGENRDGGFNVIGANGFEKLAR